MPRDREIRELAERVEEPSKHVRSLSTPSSRRPPRPLVLPSSRARAGPAQVLDKQEGGLGGAIDVMGKLVRMSAHQERQRAVHRSMQRPTAEHEKVLAQIPRDARDRIKNESSSLSASRRPP